MPFCVRFSQGTTEFLIRVLAEVLQLDVSRRRVEHDRGRHSRDVHFIAIHGQIDRTWVAHTSQGDVHRGSLRTAQLPDRLLRRPALGLLAFDLRDHVAAAKSLLICG
jgi:hypothetical protein